MGPATGDAVDPNLYSLYALVTVSGTFTDLGGLFTFEPETSTANIFTDPNRDTVIDYTDLSTLGAGEDQHIATATNVDEALSFGAVFLGAGGTVITGSYALVYEDVTLIAPDGPLYWPGLVGLSIEGTASGDVDPSGEGSIFPSRIQGDTSIAFTAPEPASMTLIGLALFGAGLAARRRRTARGGDLWLTPHHRSW